MDCVDALDDRNLIVRQNRLGVILFALFDRVLCLLRQGPCRVPLGSCAGRRVLLAARLDFSELGERVRRRYVTHAGLGEDIGWLLYLGQLRLVLCRVDVFLAVEQHEFEQLLATEVVNMVFT